MSENCIFAHSSISQNATRRNEKWVQHVVTAEIMAMGTPAPIVRPKNMNT